MSECTPRDFYRPDSSDMVYVACDSGTIAAMNLTARTTNIIAENCESGNGVTGDPENGIIYASCHENGIIAINGRNVTTLFSACISSGVYFDPSNGFVYAACDSGVFAIGPDHSIQSIATAAQCASGASITRDAASGTIYMSCPNAGIIAINGTDQQIRILANHQTQCITPKDAYYDTDSGDVYAACVDSGIIRINSTGVYHLDPTSACPQPLSIFHDSLSGVTYAACGVGDSGVVGLTDQGVFPLVTQSQCSSPIRVLLDPVDGLIYAYCIRSGLISMSGMVALVVASQARIIDPAAIAYDANTDITYVATNFDGIMTIKDGAIATIATPDQCPTPANMYRDPTNGILYATCSINFVTGSSAGSIIAIAGGAISVIANSTVCASSSSVYRDSTNGVIYAACDTNGIIAITAGGGVTQIVPAKVCQNPRDVVRREATGVIYATCYLMGGVIAIDPQHRITQLADGTECASAGGLHLDQSSGVLYVACFQSGVLAISPSGVVLTLATVDECPGALSVTRDPNTGTLYAACDNIGIIQITHAHVEKGSSGRIDSISAMRCTQPQSLFFDPVSEVLYAPCRDTGVVRLSQRFQCFPGTSWFNGECAACLAHSARRDHRSFGPCQVCQPGSIATRTASTTCAQCDAGTYEDNNLCNPCAPGSYQAMVGSTSCDSCSPGRFSLIAAARACEACHSGTATNETGALTCAPCMPGTVQPGEGQTACAACQAGSYAIVAASTVCTTCEPGFYSSAIGSSSCRPCSPGTASNVTGLDESCPACVPGTYQGGLGKTSCDQCEPNYYTEQSYATSCTKCYAQVNPERTACNTTVCPANYQYQDQTSTCEVCPLGTYSSAGGLCTVCSVNTYTPFAGSGCISCQQSGMTGLICSGGLASVAPGYWAWIEESDGADVHRDSNVHTDLSQSSSEFPLFHTALCPVGFCPGARLQSSPGVNDSASTLCLYPRLDSPDNVFCGECADGYIPWGDSCAQCSGVNAGLLFGGVFLSFLIVVFLFLSSHSSSAGGLTVLLFFVQTAALEVGPIANFIDWIHIFNLEATSTETCIAKWSPYQQTIFSLTIPIILLGELCFLGVIHYGCHRWFHHRPYSGRHQLVSLLHLRTSNFSLNEYIGGAVSILLFCYTQVAKTGLQYLYCVDAGGKQVVFNAPTMECQSDEYKAYLIPVIMVLVVYIAFFPVCVLGLLWRRRSTISAAGATQSCRLTDGDRAFVSRCSPLFRMFHPRAWFWQPFVLARRTSFVLISVWLIEESNLRFMAFSFLNFGSLLIHQLTRPFDGALLNALDTVSYACLVCLSMLLTGYAPPYSTGIQVALAIIIGPPTILFVGVTARQQWRQVTRSAEAHTDDTKLTSDAISPSPVGIESDECELEMRESIGESYRMML